MDSFIVKTKSDQNNLNHIKYFNVDLSAEKLFYYITCNLYYIFIFYTHLYTIKIG